MGDSSDNSGQIVLQCDISYSVRKVEAPVRPDRDKQHWVLINLAFAQLIQSSSDHKKNVLLEPWLENKLTKTRALILSYNKMYNRLNS